VSLGQSGLTALIFSSVVVQIQ